MVNRSKCPRRFNRLLVPIPICLLFSFIIYASITLLNRAATNEEALAPVYAEVQAKDAIKELLRIKRDALVGIQDLLRRRLCKEDRKLLKFRIMEGEAEYATWAKAGDSKVQFVGTTKSALFMALSKFFMLNRNCTLIAWPMLSTVAGRSHCRLKRGSKLFLSRERGLVRSKVPWRYYLNQVTYSYSMVWWGWERWEKELDWMALKGVNLVLAHVGQELIWERAFRRMTRSFQRDDFFTGPAYLSWNRMGNLRRLGTPLDISWMRNQVKLNHRILARMRALGITPILPAFNGFIPEEIAVGLKSNEYVHSSKWSGFNEYYSAMIRLQPTSEMFLKLGSIIVQEQLKEYASYLELQTEHMYSADMFNEMDPEEDADLANLGKQVFESFALEDSKGVLVMQMWCFAHSSYYWTEGRIAKFLSLIPENKIVLLDLHGEKRPQWPKLRKLSQERQQMRIVWTLLHNFGGTNGMAGELRLTLSQMRASIIDGNVSGVGLAMEAIEQNEIVYELVLDYAWILNNEIKQPSLQHWITQWASSRYGTSNKKQLEAWICAADTVYNRPLGLSGWGNTKSVMELQPFFGLYMDGFQPTVYAYKPYNFFQCVESLYRGALLALETDSKLDCLLYDLTDFFRQAVSDVLPILLARIKKSYIKQLEEDLRSFTQQFLRLIEQLQKLLSLHPRWTVSVIALPSWTIQNKMYHSSHLKQAKTLITQWSSESVLLHSYSSRQLAGVLPMYYARWRAFFDFLVTNIGKATITNKDRYNLSLTYKSIENFWIKNEDLETIPLFYPEDLVVEASKLHQLLQKTYRLLLLSDT